MAHSPSYPLAAVDNQVRVLGYYGRDHVLLVQIGQLGVGLVRRHNVVEATCSQNLVGHESVKRRLTIAADRPRQLAQLASRLPRRLLSPTQTHLDKFQSHLGRHVDALLEALECQCPVTGLPEGNTFLAILKSPSRKSRPATATHNMSYAHGERVRPIIGHLLTLLSPSPYRPSSADSSRRK
jgi:hypothetical protein